MKNKKILFISLGCDKNLVDSEVMLGILADRGFEMTDTEDDADIIIINTCCFINDAKEESINTILEMAEYKKTGPCKALIVTGCLAQRYKQEIVDEIPEVDAVIGTSKYDEIFDAVDQALKGSHFLDVDDLDRLPSVPGKRILTTGGHYAHLKIAEGCDKHCTYCIIPYARGRIRSKKTEDVVNEVKRLAASGCQEVVLTGIHLSSYGKERPEDQENLLTLIQAVHQVDGIERIRLGSLEPSIITDEFIDRIVDNEKVCPHFHLSLQSGCNTVLKRMNRKYTCEEYFEKCEMLRKAFDRPALTTDVIVGFPGETEEEFRETVDYLTKLNLYEMHIFKFSPRQGTVAAGMKDQVAPEIKNQRSDVLLALSERNKQAYEASFRGENLDVLVEEKVRREGKDGYRGHTERYMDIFVEEECMHRICGRQTDIINHVVKIPYGVGVE